MRLLLRVLCTIRRHPLPAVDDRGDEVTVAVCCACTKRFEFVR